jgi:hypothetical protein
MSWISVKDGLPERGKKVLVWFANEAEPYMDVWRYDGANQYFREKPSKYPLRDVTHWQPQPDPPEVAKDNE